MNKSQYIIPLLLALIFGVGYFVFSPAFNNQEASTITSPSGSKAIGGNIVSPVYPMSANYVAGTLLNEYVPAHRPPTASKFATYKFASTSTTPVTITELKFTDTNQTIHPIESVSVKVNNIVYPPVPMVNGTSYVTGMNMSVQPGAPTTMPMVITFADTGIAGIPSGTQTSLAVSYIKWQNGANSYTMCASGCTYTFNPTNILKTDTVALVGARPGIIVVPVSPTVLNAGLKKVFSVAVAAQGGDIQVNSLPISISKTGGVAFSTSANSIVIKNGGTNTTIPTTHTAFVAPSSVKVNFTTPVVVPSNGATVFDVYLSVTNAPMSSSITTKLGNAIDLVWKDLAGGNATPFSTMNVPFLSPWITTSTTLSN